MSVRDEIKDYLAKSPNATPEEIAKGLAITKIEVLGHLNVIRANVQPPATVAPPEPEPIAALAAAAKAAGDAGLVGSLDDEPEPDEAVAAMAAANDPEPEMPDFDPSTPMEPLLWTAGDITALFTSGTVMDIYAAAEFLGVQRNSVEYAVIRGTLPCAEIRGKKLFGRGDLATYAAKRAPGRKSRLTK